MITMNVRIGVSLIVVLCEQWVYIVCTVRDAPCSDEVTVN